MIQVNGVEKITYNGQSFAKLNNMGGFKRKPGCRYFCIKYNINRALPSQSQTLPFCFLRNVVHWYIRV